MLSLMYKTLVLTLIFSDDRFVSSAFPRIEIVPENLPTFYWRWFHEWLLEFGGDL